MHVANMHLHYACSYVKISSLTRIYIVQEWECNTEILWKRDRARILQCIDIETPSLGHECPNASMKSREM